MAGRFGEFLPKRANASSSKWTRFGSREASTYQRSTLTGRRVLPLRIRPAVGDQAKEARELFSKKQAEEDLEKDSDWIKIQDYVAKLNPRILSEAEQVLASSKEKWVGEGVVQEVYQEACVSGAHSVRITCSSPEVSKLLSGVLEALGGRRATPPQAAEEQTGRGTQGDATVDVGGTLVVIESALPKKGWASMLGFGGGKEGEYARISGVNFVAAEGKGEEETRQDLQARGVSTSLLGPGAKGVSIDGLEGKTGGWGAMLAWGVGSQEPASLRILQGGPEAPPSSPQALTVQEIAMGASWDEHAAAERLFDRVCGRGGMLAPGLWSLPGGLKMRLFPTDDSALQTIMIKVESLGAAQEVLEAAGHFCSPFPGYFVVMGLHGLDLRVTERCESSKFFSEMRWEVQDNKSLRASTGGGMEARESTSCAGAVTHGAAIKLSKWR